VDRETAHFQQALANRYAELVYNGVWFSTLRESLDGFFKVAQQFVTGAVGLKLWKGTLNVTKTCFAFFALSRRPRELHHGPLQPQGRRGLYQSFALPVTVRPKAKAEGSKQ